MNVIVITLVVVSVVLVVASAIWVLKALFKELSK
jgi:hypothetical protein